MNTKFTEEIKTTSNLEEMRGKYLANRLLRTWKEDFIDQDTSEVVQIERNELILERGTFLGTHELSEINFMLQSQDIKEVSVSNQQRACHVINNFTNVWSATVEINRKKKNYYLYANSMVLANNIVEDFISQKYEGSFRVISLKELDFSHLIAEDEDEESNFKKEQMFYKIEVEISSGELENYNKSFILKSTDAERAKDDIIKYLSEKRINDGDSSAFEVVIISAKTISLEHVIEYSFTEEYLTHLKDNQ